MVIEKKHQFIIGTSSIAILFILITIFMYLLYLKQVDDYNELLLKINSLESETQSQFGEISNNLIETKNELSSLGLQVGSIDSQISKLAASAGEFSGIVEDTIKSVVTIKTDVSQGSGFFIANGGFIVTNKHVMESATRATIITYDGKTHNVQKVGEDNEMDLVLLRINSTDYSPLKLGNSDDVKQGQQVIAIGNPYGLSFSVTQGIVSNIHQEGGNGADVYIQIDAPLNSGNSGGPLINSYGEVIGVNNFKIKDAEGLGFSLESNYVKLTINKIYKKQFGVDLI